ncbi:MAG: aminotransferase class III-fold pyridoxal phosphate-dependent enzyme [Phycisphaerales bacterium]
MSTTAQTSSKTTPATMTAGERLRGSAGVQQALDLVEREVRAASETITQVRGPISDKHKVDFDAFLKMAGEDRGREFMAAYMGSGAGNGPYVEMIDGSVKLDMLGGIGVHFFGHSDPDLVRTATRAAATNDLWMQGHFQANAEPYEFSHILLEQAKRSSNLAHVFLSNSGAMANENAIKICFQKKGGAPRIIAFQDCFLGRTVTMAQIGDSAGGREGIPLNTMIDYMPFYDHVAARRMGAGDVSGQTRYIDMCVWHLEQYIKRYPNQHAAFEMELIQGEGGFNTAPPEFFKALIDVCKANGIPVWDDEVQAFGRTTTMFAFEALGLGEHVDVVTVGKMSQLCATLYTKEMNPKPGLIAGTFLGSTVSAAVGKRILERLLDGDAYGPNGRHAKHHALFVEQVRNLAAKHPNWFPPAPGAADIVGGVGGMMRFTPFAGEKGKIMKSVKSCFDEGLIALYCGHDPYHIRMLPPLGVMDEKVWPEAFRIIERALEKVANG